jgi:hypothetical protein
LGKGYRRGIKFLETAKWPKILGSMRWCV